MNKKHTIYIYGIHIHMLFRSSMRTSVYKYGHTSKMNMYVNENQDVNANKNTCIFCTYIHIDICIHVCEFDLLVHADTILGHSEGLRTAYTQNCVALSGRRPHGGDGRQLSSLCQGELPGGS